MKHIVSFSGGIGSFITAMRVIEQFGKEDVELLFTDTKTEDKDLYRFMNDAVNFLDVKLNDIADGRNIWQVFEDTSYMGNSRIDPCSRVLKRTLARNWVEQHFKPSEMIMYVGISWDESHRLPKIKKNWQPYNIEAPLTNPPYLTKDDMLNMLSNIGIAPPVLYAVVVGALRIMKMTNLMKNRRINKMNRAKGCTTVLLSLLGFAAVFGFHYLIINMIESHDLQIILHVAVFISFTFWIGLKSAFFTIIGLIQFFTGLELND